MAAVQGMAQDWTLPTFSNVECNIENGGTVRSITSITYTMTDDSYDDPVNLVPGYAKPVVMFKEEGKETATEVGGVMTSVKKGVLTISLISPLAKKGQLSLTVPRGIVNNLLEDISEMTPQQIYEAGGCTNPELTLTVNVEPVKIKCVRVTNARPIGEPQFVYDAEGHLQKDKYGNYAVKYTWQDMQDHQFVPDQDYVSYIYFWFEEDFKTVQNSPLATATNLSNEHKLGVAALEFKNGNSGDGHKYDIIQFRLSSEDWLKTAERHQGLYEIYLPEGVAKTEDGMVNEACTIQFKYGDPSQAYIEQEVNLSEYEGKYKLVVEEGEIVEQDETFNVEKIEENYYITNLCGSSLNIPVEKIDGEGKFLFKKATAGSDWFMSTRGTDVEATFAVNEGKHYIYLDQYGLSVAGNTILGGARYFVREDTSGISDIAISKTVPSVMYNLAGQRVNAKTPGIVIINGKKVVK